MFLYTKLPDCRFLDACAGRCGSASRSPSSDIDEFHCCVKDEQNEHVNGGEGVFDGSLGDLPRLAVALPSAGASPRVNPR